MGEYCQRSSATTFKHVAVVFSVVMPGGCRVCMLSLRMMCAGPDWIGRTTVLYLVPVHGEAFDPPSGSKVDIEQKKGIRWMPWHQEAMKDVARCEKPWGAASRR